MAADNNTFLLITSITASISVMGSLYVILTFMIFPAMRRRMLMKMIAYISVADLLSNVGYIPTSRPSNGTPFCTIQGFLNLTTYPMSWLWTLAVVCSLYYLAHYSRTPDNGRIGRIHLICWGIPILLTCISLGFTHLGREDTYPVFEVCNYYGGLGAEIYHIFAYYGLLLVVCSLMLYLQRSIALLEIANDPRIFIATYNIAKTSLSLYPTLLIVCWLPHGVVAVVDYFDPATSSAYKEAYFVTDLLKILHGLFTAIVFFYRSSESRRSWYYLIFHGQCTIPDDDQSSMLNSTSDVSSSDSDFGYRDFSLYMSKTDSNNRIDSVDRI